MEKAQSVLSIFQGEHNFTAFKGAFRGSERKSGKVVNPTCYISRSIIQEEPTDIVDQVNYPFADFQVGGMDAGLITYTIQIEGNRFLYKMVRLIVGTVIAVGLGKVTKEDVISALNSGVWDESVRKYIVCAPAHGLMLKDVKYEHEWEDMEWITYNV